MRGGGDGRIADAIRSGGGGDASSAAAALFRKKSAGIVKSLSTDGGMGGDAKTGSEISGRDEGAGDAGGLSKMDGGGVKDGGVGGISEKIERRIVNQLFMDTGIGDDKSYLQVSFSSAFSTSRSPHVTSSSSR